MGMASSDNDEQIMREHAATETYKRLYPWRVPQRGASEMDHAFFDAEVRAWMSRAPGGYNDGRG